MIKAVGFRLVIQPDKVTDSEAEKTKKLAQEAGIALPEKIQKDLEAEQLREQGGVDQGVVLAVGPIAFKAYGDSEWCKVGDYVAYARHAGKWVKDPENNENYLIINDEDVICVMEKGSKDE